MVLAGEEEKANLPASVNTRNGEHQLKAVQAINHTFILARIFNYATEQGSTSISISISISISNFTSLSYSYLA
jgi:hypothetical protein